MHHLETPDIDATQLQPMPECLNSVWPEGEPDDWIPATDDE